MTRTRTAWARAARLALAPVVALPALLLATALTTTAAASATAAASTPGASLRVAVILFDTNTSLAGRGIAAERAAVLRYARALPPDVRVGLISFGREWRTALWPTASRPRLAHALRSIQLSGATSAGISGALAGAGTVLRSMAAMVGGRLVVFSDGEGITGRLAVAIIPTDVVTWTYESGDNAHAVRALARGSGGHIATLATAAGLAAAFPPRTTPAPASPSARSAAPGPAGHPAAARWRLSKPLIGVLAAVFLALFVIALLAIGSLRRRDLRRDLAARIERYGPRHGPGPHAGEGKVARAAVGWTARLLESSNAERGLAERLDLAGIARKPAEWVLLGACACLALAAVLTVLAGNALIGVLGGTLAGWLGMRAVVSARIGRRRGAFREQLPDVLQLVAGSLQTGFSLPQALDAVVREGTQPAAGEFGRALAEARIGVDLEPALGGIADRMDSTDLRWTIMAIRIQREVGGNLVEVLRNTVDTMRERESFRRHVRALNAEGRLSAYILAALPLLIGGWLLVTDRGYLHLLYTTPAGLAMLCGAGVLFVIGVLWMRVLIRVEV